MATTTVTGLTADRMLAIEDASVVDGDIVGDNLILTRHDGVTIDAGSVRGDIGPMGPAGSVLPVFTNAAARDAAIPTPSPGMECVLTSTGEYLIYQSSTIAGVAGWYPPWNTSWGEFYKRYSSSSPTIGTSGADIMGTSQISALNLVKNRLYRLDFHCADVSKAGSPGYVKVKLNTSTEDVAMFGEVTLDVGARWSIDANVRIIAGASVEQFPPEFNAGSSVQFIVKGYTSAGTAVFNSSNTSDPGPSWFRVVDEGPV